MSGSFWGLVLREELGKVVPRIEALTEADLPSDGDVLVRVTHSTLNYKDGMMLKGLGRLVRKYPHVTGIDFAGIVEQSDAPAYKPGDEVILTGWRVGETRWGGFAQKNRLKAEWLVPLPKGMTRAQAMAMGTAGFTAMLALLALEEHGLTPAGTTADGGGEVLVTGAAGGVGSVATVLLARAGYKVAASTGRESEHAYLKSLGAASIVPRAELEAKPSGPLASERWAGAIDNVGGPILANLLAALRRNASCAAVGLAASNKLETTVVPFLLRGVNLLGIDSGLVPYRRRVAAWERIARDFDWPLLDKVQQTIGLGDLATYADKILAGQVRGRVVVDLEK
jgi:acrylyl-CoA reductase (NADPH)